MASSVDFLEQLCEDWDETVSTVSLEKIEALFTEEGAKPLSSENASFVALLCQTVADITRHEPNRLLFKQDVCAITIISFLRQSLDLALPNVILQCLRAASNLCYEHTENRLKLSSLGVSSLLARSISDKQLLRPCAAVVANLASESDAALNACRDHPVLFDTLLSAFIEGCDIDTVNRAIANLYQTPENLPFCIERGDFRRLATILSNYSHPARAHIISILTNVFESPDAPHVSTLMHHLIVDCNLISIVLSALTDPDPAEVAAEAVELEEQNKLPHFAARTPLDRQKLGMTLATIGGAADESLQPPYYPFFEKFAHLACQSNDLIAQRCGASILGFLVLRSDHIRSQCFGMIDQFLQAMSQQQLPRADTDTQIGLIMIIANAIDSPQRAERVMELNGHQNLAPFLDQQYDPRVVHLTLGTFLKLAMNPDHKRHIVAAGIVPAVDAVLNHSRDVTILYAGVSIIRSLIALHERELQHKVLESAPILDTLVSLWDRVWEKGTERVLFEAARIIAHLIMDDWAELCRSHDAMNKPLAALISSPYEILRTEGWKALSVLFANTSDREAVLLPVLNAIDKEVTSLDLTKMLHPDLVTLVLSTLSLDANEYHPVEIDLSSNPLNDADHLVPFQSWLSKASAYLHSLKLRDTNLSSEAKQTLSSTYPNLIILLE